MDEHLGTGTTEVHDAAQQVLGYWFDALTPEQHFAKDESVDRTIAERFGALRDDVLAADALGWRSEPDHLLAAILLLDQFSRNIHRDDPQAYAADPLALSLAQEGIERGWHEALAPEHAQFLLMPLMHAESRDMAGESVARFEALGRAENVTFAHDHADVIARFGRYPSRNAALGRESTPEEVEYLAAGGGW